MENEELREKLLCVLKNHIQDFEIKHIEESFYSDYIYNGVILSKSAVYKKITIDIPPKYFWHKQKQKEVGVVDYYTFDVSYGEYRTKLTKEEYEEIMQIRQEKIKQKQLEELTKLCNGN